MNRYENFDRFGFAPPSFVFTAEDEGLVTTVQVRISGQPRAWPMLTAAGRQRYERDGGGPPPQGWATSSDLVMSQERLAYTKHEIETMHLSGAVGGLTDVREFLTKANLHADAGALDTMHSRLKNKLQSMLATGDELREKANRSES